MTKRIRLSSVSIGSWDTDWFKYCLCQGDTIESLISSAEGYQMLAKHIPLFNEVNALPIPMDIRRLDDDTGIDATLIGNNAKYHNSCRIKFNNTKLLRVQKRVKSQVPATSLEEYQHSSGEVWTFQKAQQVLVLTCVNVLYVINIPQCLISGRQ
jgi:hypothetical protein